MWGRFLVALKDEDGEVIVAKAMPKQRPKLLDRRKGQKASNVRVELRGVAVVILDENPHAATVADRDALYERGSA